MVNVQISMSYDLLETTFPAVLGFWCNAVDADDPAVTVNSIRVEWGDGTHEVFSGNAVETTHTYQIPSDHQSHSYQITVAAYHGGQTTDYSSFFTIDFSWPYIAANIVQSAHYSAAGATVTYTATCTSGFVDLEGNGWQWTIPNGTITASTNTDTVSTRTVRYDGVGTFGVSCTASNPNSSRPLSIVHYVIAPPSASFTEIMPTQAPYTVQFADTSTGTIGTWSWDFGNGTTSNQRNPSCTYASTGTYTVRLTVRDVLSRTSTATKQLVVTVVPSIVTSSVVPLSGQAPLVVICRAVATGDPLPAVTWDMGDGTTETTPAPQTGPRTESYVEHSFRRQGTYAITLTATSTAGTSTAVAFEVAVSGSPDVPVVSVETGKPQIWAVGDLDRVVAVIDDYDYLTYVSRYRREDSFEFAMSRASRHVEYTNPGRILMIGIRGRVRVCVVTQIGDTGDYLTISGMDYAGLLFSSRVALINTRGTTGTGYDTQTGAAESILRYFAAAQLQTVGGVDRTDNRFAIVGVDGERGIDVTYSARLQPTLEILESICLSSDLGWDSALQQGGGVIVGWRVIEGQNRTVGSGEGTVAFSELRGNARVSQYYEALSPTVAVVGGADSGAVRDQVIVGESASTGVMRREIFVDARDAADLSELEQRGEVALGDTRELTIEIDLVPRAGGAWEYIAGTDYDIGDIVSIGSRYHGAYEMRIVAIHQAWKQGGESISLEMGSEYADIQKSILSVNKHIPVIRQ